MSEPVSRARGDTLDARYIECARPTGGSHGLTIDDATQRFKGTKRRPRQKLRMGYSQNSAAKDSIKAGALRAPAR